MRTCLSLSIMVALMVTVAVCQSSAPKPIPAPKPLEVSDRLQIRDIQLSLAQAHITRLQAEAQIKSLEAQLGQTIESLKVQYSCPGCILNVDFTWTKPKPVKAPDSTEPPDPQKDGPNPTKE